MHREANRIHYNECYNRNSDIKMKGTPNSGNQHRVEGSRREVISQPRAYRTLSKRRDICEGGDKGGNFQKIETGTT